MSKLLELRQKAGMVLDNWQKALEARDNETNAEQRKIKSAEVDRLKGEHETFMAEIRSHESIEAAKAEAAGQAASDNSRQTQRASEEVRISKKYSLLRALQHASKGKTLDGLEGEMQQEAVKEARSAGLEATGQLQIPSMLFRVPNQQEQRDMTVGTNSAGGYTVQTNVEQLIPILQPRLVTAALGATVLTGLNGNLQFPRNNADATAVWEGENTDNDQTDPTFDSISMSPHRLGAFAVIGKQLMFQSSISVEQFVRGRLNFAIQKALDTAAINGSGSSNQPTGILNTSGIGSVAIGTNGGNATWANIVALESALTAADADQADLAYLTTPGIRGKLKTTQKVSGVASDFIWLDFLMGAPGTSTGMLNGFKALTSTLTPSTLTKGTSSGVCHAILFGNWSELLIAQWAGLDIVLDNITLAGKAQVKIIVNSWWDLAVRHAASFAAIKDATTT